MGIQSALGERMTSLPSKLVPIPMGTSKVCEAIDDVKTKRPVEKRTRRPSP